MPSKYRPNYWGRLSQFQIPHGIINDNKLILSPSALTILLILLQIARSRQPRNLHEWIEVKVSQKLLRERSGLSKDVITRATGELEDRQYLKRISGHRMKRGEFGANSYTLCDPSGGEPLLAGTNNFLFGNKVRYFCMPRCVVTESDANWSLASMSGSQVRLYVALGWLANKHKANQFEVNETELKNIADFSTLPVTRRALNDLMEKPLIWVSPSQDNKTLTVELLDPYTGEPLHEQTPDPEDDPANYYVTPSKGRTKRINLNTGAGDQVVSLVLSCLPNPASVVWQSNGDFKITCPFHTDTDPSCSVSPKKNCFHCFGCQKKGTVTELVMKLRSLSKGEAIQLKAQHLGADVEFHQPDKSTEAIYDYLDRDGKRLKQVIRYPGKKFAQRRPYKNGWVWDTSGVRPSLYNLHRLGHASTVCICEGEKDCDTVTNLSLKDADGGEVIAVTAGGSDSWRDQFAVELVGKQVVLMPDDDEPGHQFARAIKASLDMRGIPNRTVTFNDVGAKDVSEFLANGHTREELAERIGADWIECGTEQVFTIP